MNLRQKRHFDRRAFERIVALDLGDGSAATSSEIADISNGGARLRPLMCTPKAVPETFTLMLSACGRVRRSCTVMWRTDDELGVKFNET